MHLLLFSVLTEKTIVIKSLLRDKGFRRNAPQTDPEWNITQKHTYCPAVRTSELV